MLQLPKKQSAKPKPSVKPDGESALDIIDASIQPLGDEPDLLDTLCWMSDQNDILGMIALYDAFAGIAQQLRDTFNQARVDGRAADFVEAEYARAWSKAYLIASFLKDMRPSKFQLESYSETLFRASIQMGSNFAEAVAVVNEIATWNIERKNSGLGGR